MSDDFFRNPVLNSPYEPPTHHWELDEDRQPTTERREGRRSVSFVTLMPKPRKRRASQGQLGLAETTTAVQEDSQKYELAQTINSVTSKVMTVAPPVPGQTPLIRQCARRCQHGVSLSGVPMTVPPLCQTGRFNEGL